MAARTGRKPGPKGKSTKTTAKRTYKRKTAAQERMDEKVRDEVMLLVTLAVAILLFLCNFHIIGSVGDALSRVMFGIFGWLAYVAPLFLFLALVFGVINMGSRVATIKLCAGILLFLILDIFAALMGGLSSAGESVGEYYSYCAGFEKGGGVVGTFFAAAMHNLLGMIGTIAVLLIFMIICLVVITEKSFIGGVKKSSKHIYDTAKTDAERRKELNEIRRAEKMEQAKRNELEKEAMKSRRMDRKVSGVALDVTIPGAVAESTAVDEAAFAQKAELPKKTGRAKKNIQTNENIHEISMPNEIDLDSLAGVHISGVEFADSTTLQEEKPAEINVTPIKHPVREHLIKEADPIEDLPFVTPDGEVATVPAQVHRNATAQSETGLQQTNASQKVKIEPKDLDLSDEMQKAAKPVRPYQMPPLSLLKKGENKSGGQESARELKETALKLQQTLKTFGVNVTITDISKGPAVTRYELQPEVGVKVSKIVNLADDIKLNLAATDIRIEAPIPGKAAIGIEVPNKENSAVALRDLLEAKEFKEFSSKIAFAVGKDISGKVVVTDIGKMPHLLIAGATGSGKSVCINTLIMSLLYKAKPDEVKMILIDPKVVELSVYNGIPHLMIPVVTDPKKAAAALNWGVAEMTDRYKKFADLNVRDLKGYNQKVSEMETNNGEELPEKLPQIVIIVDELADLMMVAPGEVEESICRLAQLARAAGIHLVIATQRPSVDVITGLIKANMPSRIAFSVSSGVDSRTILDMNGAEKLLGKGDMLFYPQGLSKPARVQGAFVSDKEVSEIVDFLKEQCDGEAYSPDVAEKISTMVTAAGAAVAGGGSSERDEYFEEAARFIIDKDKASIGMLQRVFKIGFNRAARIMDQLSDLGVVGEEEGTKPRKVLMSLEQFEQLLEEI